MSSANNHIAAHYESMYVHIQQLTEITSGVFICEMNIYLVVDNATSRSAHNDGSVLNVNLEVGLGYI